MHERGLSFVTQNAEEEILSQISEADSSSSSSSPKNSSSEDALSSLSPETVVTFIEHHLLNSGATVEPSSPPIRTTSPSTSSSDWYCTYKGAPPSKLGYISVKSGAGANHTTKSKLVKVEKFSCVDGRPVNASMAQCCAKNVAGVAVDQYLVRGPRNRCFTLRIGKLVAVLVCVGFEAPGRAAAPQALQRQLLTRRNGAPSKSFHRIVGEGVLIVNSGVVVFQPLTCSKCSKDCFLVPATSAAKDLVQLTHWKLKSIGRVEYSLPLSLSASSSLVREGEDEDRLFGGDDIYDRMVKMNSQEWQWYMDGLVKCCNVVSDVMKKTNLDKSKCERCADLNVPTVLVPLSRIRKL